ncbi:threonine ammonia-lyase [Sphingomicrobium sediminis]|uniref:Threonine ammonia-lyase n=1 Tax=Sphingomicrobium sediminis TaxID=2950949 RepID=A0A9X2EHD0_9SPHN|nr:threonine ammonia-lyase [Sphingomicrobium sediminis]MCM8557511.1 threonine ammonia-lyase [Sphingomicrobium sediminis]
MEREISIEDIRAAAARIEGAVVDTPMSKSRTLSEIVGADIWLKFENLQFTAAYKERGALNKLRQLSPEECKRGVIAASAGNHAQAVAYHGARLGIPVTIVMPAPTPTIKVEQTEGHGAHCVLEGKVFDDAYAHAQALADEKGYVFVHPFDDPDVIAGQGTVGLEMLRDVPDLDVLVVPIGGGGLMSGIAIAAKAINPDIELVGVEAEMFPAMKCIIEGKGTITGGDTLAEGIAVKEPGKITRAIIADLVDRIELVPEAAIEHAVALLVGIEKTVVEGAGAAGLALLLDQPDAFKGKKVGTVLCGGNIDPHLLSNVLVRELVRAGRIARLKIAAEDRPGALAAITAKFHEHRVNILETNHHRIFNALPAKDTLIEVECEARDAAAIDRLVDALEECGFNVERADRLSAAEGH